MEALTAAVVALLQDASPACVRRVLRTLLDEEPVAPAVQAVALESAAAAIAMKPNGAAHPVRRPGRSKRPGPRTVKPPVADPAWEQLRSELRAAMGERHAGYAAIAAAIGMSELTVRLGICRTQSPGKAMMAKLRAWLAAPAVAGASPFPGRGAGNGAAA
jgi:hypothetical protein